MLRKFTKCLLALFAFMSRIPLGTLYLTYEKGDLLGYALAWGSSFPYFIMSYEIICLAMFAVHYFMFTSKTRKPGSVTYWWPEGDQRSLVVWMGWLVSGLIFNEILASFLKRTLRHPRPILSDRIEYGNPSSHAQFMAFYTLFVLSRMLKMFKSSQGPGSPKGRTPAFWMMLLYSLILFSLLSVVCVSRVYLGYHYLHQIFSGLTIGVSFSLLWNAAHSYTSRKTLKTD